MEISTRRSSLLVIALLLAGCDSGAVVPPPARPVRVEAVRLEPADDIVRYAAVVRSRVEANLGFRVGGKVAERLVDVGSRVVAGAPIARLDTTDFELQIRATAAQLAAMRADAANARADYERYARLRQGEWTTQQEYDRRKTTVERAEARVRELDAQLSVVRNNARYATLLADGDGVVMASLIEPGQVVAAGQTAFRVARTGQIEVAANIPEHQVVTLDATQLVVELWSLPGARFAGQLRELSPNADPATRTYEARVTLLDPPPEVQLGMTATLIARKARDGRIARLPLTALTQSGAEPAVWVLSPSGDRVELRPVTVASYAEERALVTAGLAEGDLVVTAGTYKLDPGVKVRVWTEPLR
jgi:RND family efflux transporter MFP subunit